MILFDFVLEFRSSFIYFYINWINQLKKGQQHSNIHIASFNTDKLLVVWLTWSLLVAASIMKRVRWTFPVVKDDPASTPTECTQSHREGIPVTVGNSTGSIYGRCERTTTTDHSRFRLSCLTHPPQARFFLEYLKGLLCIQCRRHFSDYLINLSFLK